MPGSISDSYTGSADAGPYIPSWGYKYGPRMCPCGHHEGYHNDNGKCLLVHECRCAGIPPHLITPIENM
jgi:hypothetical protein